MKSFLLLTCMAALAQPPVDNFAGHPRAVIISDIGNEPDDQMSLVRLLLYSNEIDIEALIAGTSTWQKTIVHPETMRTLIWTQGGDMLSRVTSQDTRSRPMDANTSRIRPRSGMARCVSKRFRRSYGLVIAGFAHANHNPLVDLNGQSGEAWAGHQPRPESVRYGATASGVAR